MTSATLVHQSVFHLRAEADGVRKHRRPDAIAENRARLRHFASAESQPFVAGMPQSSVNWRTFSQASSAKEVFDSNIDGFLGPGKPCIRRV